MRPERLITPPLDPEAVATAFERIVDRVQNRIGCDRVQALQLVCSEHPGAFERYLSAMIALSKGNTNG